MRRVKYSDVNLVQQGTVESTDGQWSMVRWDCYPNYVVKEWTVNLKEVSNYQYDLAVKYEPVERDGGVVLS